MTDVNYRDLASRWWVQAATPELNKRARNKPILEVIFSVAFYLGQQTDGLADYLKQLSPRKSKKDPESLAYYDNSYKYANERLTKVGPGRFLKKLFPQAPDNVVEGFTIWWKNNIAFDLSEYALVIGKTQQDFKDAFTKYRRSSGLYYRDYRKSISDSCMKYKFPALAYHPAEVYASGDFEVVTVKDRSGKTRARCVVRIKKLDGSPCYDHGYIYASDNYSAELIENHLAGMDGVAPNNPHKEGYFWHEARLLKLKAGPESDYSICPYVDGNRYVSGYDSSHIILVQYDDSYETVGNSTSGSLYIRSESSYKNYLYKRVKKDRK